VWCHHALAIEAALDRNDGVSPRARWSLQTDRARQEIAVADRVLQAKSGRLNPTDWAELAQQAATIREQAVRKSESSEHLRADNVAKPSRDASSRH
jgi:hypothetical protein